VSTLRPVRRALVAVLIAVGLAALAAEARAAGAAAPSQLNPFSAFVGSTGAVQAWARADGSLCRRPGAYSWPVRPFDRPHPIRGNFGDPRTVYGARGKSFSFHNGVDIYAPDGTPVYPVASGTVVFAGADEIIVRTPDGIRSFQYWHVVPSVHAGEQVVARRTLLGRVRLRAGHVHLTEVEDAIVRNPLAPGHLAPYRDRTPPTVRAISFRSPAGAQLDAGSLDGLVSVVVWAQDTTSLPVPGEWHGFPVAPAKLTLAVETLAGAPVVWPQTVFDFTTTTPDPELFWHVYAPGTYQNRPAVGRRLYTGTPGRYLYTAQLPTLEPGSYRLRVTAEDVCGNTGSLSLPIGVTARTGPAASPSPIPTEPPPAPSPTILPPIAVPPVSATRAGAAWPRGSTAYTVVLASVPEAEGATAAAAVAARARGAELPRVGVLRSSGFTSLTPGYRVVFSGVYGTAGAAANAAFDASARYPGAYPRLIVPDALPPARHVAKRAPATHRTPARGHYAVLAASVPEADGYAAARDEARRALDAGLARARVVHSAAVSGLRLGFYVVLATGYLRGAADAAVARVAPRYPTAYVRLLPPRTASAASSRRPCPPSPSASPSCTPSSGSALR
jgi:Peptidase family M23